MCGSVKKHFHLHRTDYVTGLLETTVNTWRDRDPDMSEVVMVNPYPSHPAETHIQDIYILISSENVYVYKPPTVSSAAVHKCSHAE